MPRRSRPTLIVASLLAAACLGAGGGAVAYATLHDNGTDTVVRQVTVQEADSASAAALSVNQIYRGAYRGVVEIVVTESGSIALPGGGSQPQQAQGSGWVYDSDGHIVTNDHVVDGAPRSGPFWNGKTYSAHARRHRQVDRPRGDQGRRARLRAPSARGRRLEQLSGR